MSLPQTKTPAAPGETIDAFHRGRFHLVQPRGTGHRAGMDAMLLASLVPTGATGHVADLGAGAGAAGLAVAARLPAVHVALVERAPLMAEFARRSVALAENAGLADRVRVVEADVTLTGAARRACGLADDSFHHVIMNPPFNEAHDRRTPDPLKAEAHAMPPGMFEHWLRTAGAILRPGGQVSLIARPQSLAEILAACARRFGALQLTPVHPRPGADAIRLLVTGIKGSRAALALRAPLFMHDGEGHAFCAAVDRLNNGLAAYDR